MRRREARGRPRDGGGGGGDGAHRRPSPGYGPRGRRAVPRARRGVGRQEARRDRDDEVPPDGMRQGAWRARGEDGPRRVRPARQAGPCRSRVVRLPRPHGCGARCPARRSRQACRRRSRMPARPDVPRPRAALLVGAALRRGLRAAQGRRRPGCRRSAGPPREGRQGPHGADASRPDGAMRALSQAAQSGHPRYPSHGLLWSPPEGRAPGTRPVRGFFRDALWGAGISRGGRGKGPRVHDPRLAFACHGSRGWVDAGDVGAPVPCLATCMGHAGTRRAGCCLRLTAGQFPGMVARVGRECGWAVPSWAPATSRGASAHVSDSISPDGATPARTPSHRTATCSSCP